MTQKKILIGRIKIAEDNTIDSQHINETRYQQLLESVQDYAIYWLDLEGRVESWNSGAQHIKGYSANEVIGRSFSLFFTEEDQKNDLPQRSLETARSQGKFECEGWRVCKDGSKFWASVALSAIHDRHGNVTGYAKVTRDITERKKFEQALEATRRLNDAILAEREKLIKKLVESNGELERFAYVASHDMQEPLRMISNFGRLISEEYGNQLDKEGNEYVHLVTESAVRMQQIVEDLLEYARIDNEGMRLVTIDGTKEVKHVLESLSSIINELGACATYDPLPKLKGNSVQFMRLLQNLVGNALKYHAEGTAPQIHIGAEEQGEHWCFSIRDNGIGIPKEYATQIFEPFKRLHSWSEYQGTGIGLAICKKIVENHGGRIWAASEIGKGSTFYFTWPKIKAEES